MLLLVFSSNLKLNMKQEPSKPLSGPRQAPDFKQVRKYLKDTSQRENLGEFIKVGWSPAELAEYGTVEYLAPGRTYPTASSYQVAVSFGPECPVAQIIWRSFVLLDTSYRPSIVRCRLRLSRETTQITRTTRRKSDRTCRR